jgi:hypothetical protein
VLCILCINLKTPLAAFAVQAAGAGTKKKTVAGKGKKPEAKEEQMERELSVRSSQFRLS